MSWALEILELDQDADERTIKRAYARLLRSNRPDDDPAAFQRLNEAYRAALRWAQWQQHEAAGSGDMDGTHSSNTLGPFELVPDEIGGHVVTLAEPVHPPATTPAPTFAESLPEQAVAADPAVVAGMPSLPEAPLPLDIEAACEFILTQARALDPVSLDEWLQKCPELWSLPDKARVGALLMWRLQENDEAINAANFDVLMHCFGWDEVNGGFDPYHAQQCRERLNRNWMLQPAGSIDLARHLRGNGRHVTALEARHRIQLLCRPFQRLPALWAALPSWRPIQMVHLLKILGIHDAADAPPPLQPKQVEFWLAAGDSSQLSAPRFQLALLRGAVTGLVFLMLTVLSWALLALFTPSPLTPVSLNSFLKAGYWGAGGLFACRTLLPLWGALMRWLSADEACPQPQPMLRLWLIPLLAVASILVIHQAGQRVVGDILAWLVLWMAVMRFRQRGRHAFRFAINPRAFLFVFVAAPFLKLLVVAIAFGELPAIAALLFWLRDAWVHVWRKH